MNGDIPIIIKRRDYGCLVEEVAVRGMDVIMMGCQGMDISMIIICPIGEQGSCDKHHSVNFNISRLVFNENAWHQVLTCKHGRRQCRTFK